MYVRLTPAFKQAIVTDSDPKHPFGPALHIVKGNTERGQEERPVYQVEGNAFIQGKIREGILEEVRDFSGTPRNDPEHEDHPDNPDNYVAATAGRLQPATFAGALPQSASQVEDIVSAQIAGLEPGLRQLVSDAVAHKLAAAGPAQVDPAQLDALVNERVAEQLKALGVAPQVAGAAGQGADAQPEQPAAAKK